MRQAEVDRHGGVRPAATLVFASAFLALAVGTFACRERAGAPERPVGSMADARSTSSARLPSLGPRATPPAPASSAASPASSAASPAAGGPFAAPSEGVSGRPLGPGLTVHTTTFEGEAGGRLAWRVLRVDLSSVALSIAPVPDARLERLAEQPSLRFAVNAGFFEPSREPSGLLVSRGRQLGALRPRGGSGVLWVERGRAQILPSRGPLPDARAAEVALQCGPRLVEGGRSGMHGDDGRRAARTAICLREGGRVLDIVLTWDPAHPGDGPGLYRLAELLTLPSPFGDAEGCEEALNLDGGPSTGLIVRSMPDVSSPQAPGPVPWALVARTSLLGTALECRAQPLREPGKGLGQGRWARHS